MWCLVESVSESAPREHKSTHWFGCDMFWDIHVNYTVTLANGPLDVILHDISLVLVSEAIAGEGTVHLQASSCAPPIY